MSSSALSSDRTHAGHSAASSFLREKNDVLSKGGELTPMSAASAHARRVRWNPDHSCRILRDRFVIVAGARKTAAAADHSLFSDSASSPPHDYTTTLAVVSGTAHVASLAELR